MSDRDPLESMREADETDGEGRNDEPQGSPRPDGSWTGHGPDNDTEHRYGEDESPA
jgi:hypothetical protein